VDSVPLLILRPYIDELLSYDEQSNSQGWSGAGFRASTSGCCSDTSRKTAAVRTEPAHEACSEGTCTHEPRFRS